MNSLTAVYNKKGRLDKMTMIRSRLVLFVCVEVLRPSQQLWSCQASQLPINTVAGQA